MSFKLATMFCLSRLCMEVEKFARSVIHLVRKHASFIEPRCHMSKQWQLMYLWQDVSMAKLRTGKTAYNSVQRTISPGQLIYIRRLSMRWGRSQEYRPHVCWLLSIGHKRLKGLGQPKEGNCLTGGTEASSVTDLFLRRPPRPGAAKDTIKRSSVRNSKDA